MFKENEQKYFILPVHSVVYGFYVSILPGHLDQTTRITFGREEREVCVRHKLRYS